MCLLECLLYTGSNSQKDAKKMPEKYTTEIFIMTKNLIRDSKILNFYLLNAKYWINH